MNRKSWTVLVFFSLIAGILLTSCDKKPKTATFIIKVSVYDTNDKYKGLPGVKVYVDNKKLGHTDKYGTFVGKLKGDVGKKIKIKLIGDGQGNVYTLSKKLRVKKNKQGRWVPQEIKVTAFLQPSAAGEGDEPEDNIPTDEPEDDGGTGGPPGPVVTGGNGTGTDVPGTPGGTVTSENGKSNSPTPAPPHQPTGTNGTGTVTPPPITNTPLPPEKPKGEYKISITADAPGVAVYCRGCRRYSLGTIRDAGGKIEYLHKDKRPTPRPLTFIFKIKNWKERKAYKNWQVTQKLELDPGQENYEVSATFEKKPPIKIAVSANVSGIKVILDGEPQGEIVDPSQPLELEYTKYWKRSATVILKPTDPKVKPRRIIRRVYFKNDVYSYNVEGKFKAPEPPAQPLNPVGAGISGGEGLGAPTIQQPKPSGVYKITITTNAENAAVYVGRRRVGVIREPGGSIVYTHKDKRSRPRPITVRVRPKNRYAYTKSELREVVELDPGREEYRVELNFEKRPAIRISISSNIPGVKVRVNGRTLGTITSPGTPLTYEHVGRPIRRVRIEAIPPNPRAYTPPRVRTVIAIRPGQYEYSFTAEFNEVDLGEKVVIRPRCFRRSRKAKRIVILSAAPGTQFILKGDCGNEPLAKAGKSGRIKVAMPVDSWQRVLAIVKGVKLQKVVEVTRGRSPLVVKFSSKVKKCHLKRIHKKIINKIHLEEEEVACLSDLKKNHPEYFNSQIFLSRFYCQQRLYRRGSQILDKLGRDPRNRNNPYRALKIGIEYGRCKNYQKAAQFLKIAERLAIRFSPRDRYVNKKNLYRAMAAIYEQRYYRTKNIVYLVKAHKSAERLAEIIRPSERREKLQAQKNARRLKKMLTEKGSLDEE